MKVKKLTALIVFVGISVSTAFAVDLARVNGKLITEKDLNSALGNLNEGQRRKVLSDANSKREILSTLVEQELLTQEGEKQKMDQEAAYKEALAQFRRAYLSQRVIEKFVAPRLGEAAVKKFYTMNKRKYSNDKVEVMHILLPDEKSANDVMKMAKAPNADFAALAEKYSKDPSAKNNRGYIGPIGWDAPFVMEFKEAAFEGQKGEVVGPVKSTYGYHVIKVQDKRAGVTKNFEEVELVVREDLKRELVEEYLVKLRKSAQIQMDSKALEKI